MLLALWLHEGEMQDLLRLLHTAQRLGTVLPLLDLLAGLLHSLCQTILQSWGERCSLSLRCGTWLHVGFGKPAIAD
jgi:hypothetical protein